MSDDGRKPPPDPMSDRLPPQDLQAEQATLGAMLVDAGSVSRALAIVSPEDFYREAHSTIMTAIRDVDERNDPVDMVTVGAELRRNNQLEALGGAEYLSALIGQVPTTAHVVRYATIVAEKALLRRLIRAGGEIQGMAYEDPEEVAAALDQAEQRIFEIAQGRSTGDFEHIGPLAQQTMKYLEDVSRNKGFISGIPTGLTDFDNLTSGLHKGELVIIAGRPAMGKTSLLVNNIAMHAALHGRRTNSAGEEETSTPVGIFSLEMSSSQLAEMLLCGRARVNSWRLKAGKAHEDDWLRIAQAVGELAGSPIFIDDTPGISILEIRSKARRLKSQHDVGMIVVDYLQLTSGGGRYEDSRHQEISVVARSLKSMARELDIPVVVGSQLSRNVERREEKRPILSDLAESGSIEAEADLVCFLYREAYYQRKKAAEEVQAEADKAAQTPRAQQYDVPDVAELIVSKHRNGPVGTVKLAFHENSRIFDSVSSFRQSEDY